MAIIQGIKDGLSVDEIALGLGMKPQELRLLRKQMLHVLTDQYLEFIEFHRAVNFARLEDLYSVAAPLATGRGKMVIPDKDEPEGYRLIPTNPSKDWMREAVNIISKETELMAIDSQQQRLAKENQSKSDYSQVTNPTLISGGDLFDVAQDAMQEAWIKQGFADYDQYDLLDAIQSDAAAHPELIENAVMPDVSVLSKRIEKMEEKLGEARNDPDAD